MYMSISMFYKKKPIMYISERTHKYLVTNKYVDPFINVWAWQRNSIPPDGKWAESKSGPVYAGVWWRVDIAA